MLRRLRVAARARRHHGPVILLYHRVADPSVDPWSLCVSPRHFAEHMEVLERYLRPTRLGVLTRPQDAGRARRNGRAAVAVTFDDGYADNLHTAHPVLRKHDVPATLFVVSGALGSPVGFWWDRLESLLLDRRPLPPGLRLQLAGTWREWTFETRDTAGSTAHLEWRHPEPPPNPRAELFLVLHETLSTLPPPDRERILDELTVWRGTGHPEALHQEASCPRPLTDSELLKLTGDGLVEVGAHTVTHPRLSSLSRADQEAEIRGSRDALQALVNQEVTAFSYPHGGRGDFDQGTETLVRDAGFDFACMVRSATLRNVRNRYALPRFYVRDCDGDALAERLSSWVVLGKPRTRVGTVSRPVRPQAADEARHSMESAPETHGAADGDAAARVSVIIIFHNERRFLAEAIESVRAQSLTSWEIVLVDDGSTDESPAIARQYASQDPQRVRVVQHPNGENRGMSASRNLGVRNAHGAFVAFLDADDVFLPHKLEHQVQLLGQHPEVAWVFGRTEYWHGWTGEPGDQARDRARRHRVPDGLSRAPRLAEMYLRGKAQPPAVCGVLIRKEAFLAIGGFEEEFRGMLEDQAFFLKLALAMDAWVDSRICERYRQHPDSHCAQALRTGEWSRHRGSPSHERYIWWAEDYLVRAEITDPDLHAAWRVAARPYLHPVADRVLSVLSGLVRRVRRGFSRPARSPRSSRSDHARHG